MKWNWNIHYNYAMTYVYEEIAFKFLCEVFMWIACVIKPMFPYFKTYDKNVAWLFWCEAWSYKVHPFQYVISMLKQWHVETVVFWIMQKLNTKTQIVLKSQINKVIITKKELFWTLELYMQACWWVSPVVEQ